jgi:hypothetical protein
LFVVFVWHQWKHLHEHFFFCCCLAPTCKMADSKVLPPNDAENDSSYENFGFITNIGLQLYPPSRFDRQDGTSVWSCSQDLYTLGFFIYSIICLIWPSVSPHLTAMPVWTCSCNTGLLQYHERLAVSRICSVLK